VAEVTVDGKQAVLLGAGGHAKVVLSLARVNGLQVIGVCDPALAGTGVTQWRGLEVLGGDEALGKLSAEKLFLLNGVGQVVGSDARRALYERCRAQGFRFPTLVHPTACVDASARLADGVQVMAAAVVQADAVVGENTIVNTGASIDHDGRIGSHVHVAPGAVLCGDVEVADRAFIGSGALILPGVRVGLGAIVAAGSTLPRSLGEGQRHRPHSA
jgi:sugar O-acyltransferase (sialic acid O-acetyltransferase NeuD family)